MKSTTIQHHHIPPTAEMRKSVQTEGRIPLKDLMQALRGGARISTSHRALATANAVAEAIRERDALQAPIFPEEGQPYGQMDDAASEVEIMRDGVPTRLKVIRREGNTTFLEDGSCIVRMAASMGKSRILEPGHDPRVRQPRGI